MVEHADLSRLSIPREEGARRGRPRARRWPYIVLAVLVLGIAAATWVVVRGNRGPEVTVVRAALRGGGAGGGGLTANGYVVARTKASVSSKVAGRLTFLGVEEGDQVQRGAIIARLEAAEYEALVRQTESEALAALAVVHEAEATVAQAQRAYDRAIALDTLVAEQTREDARTAVETANARLAAANARLAAARQSNAGARASLDNTLIRAPFTGTVLRKDAEVGEVVAPAVAGGGLTRGAVVTMADLSTLEVEVDVNEAYIAQIRDDQPAAIILDAYPAQEFDGHVRQVVPTADRQKATVLVRVAIDSNDPRILPEMGARVEFRERQDSTAGPAVPERVVIPAGTVRSDGGQDIVWIVVDGRAQRQVIDAGPVMGNEREVRSGLQGGETLILDPPAGLTDGARVRVLANSSGGNA